MADFVDDPSIRDEEILWRRVSPEQITPREGPEPPPAPKLAFTSNKVLISVNRASLTTVEATLAGYPNHSLLQVTAAAVREAGCLLIEDRKPDNPAHALIVGTAQNGRLTGSQAKKIAVRASWVVCKV